MSNTNTAEATITINALQEKKITLMVPVKEIGLFGNYRTEFPEDSIRELAESMKQNGQINPLTVRPWPQDKQMKIPQYQYQLVSGERRLKAAQVNGWENIMVIVRELTDLDVLNIQLAENKDREAVHPLNEAAMFAKMLEAGMSKEEIANKHGISIPTVVARLEMNNLCDEAKKYFIENIIGVMHAHVLIKHDHEQQRILLKSGIQEIKTTGKKSEYNAYGPKFFEQKAQELFIRNLDKAPFSTTEENIFPGAPTCHTCIKRSGCNMDLFGNNVNAAAGENICFDAACFQGKITAVVDRKILAVLEKEPEIHLIHNWGYDEHIEAQKRFPDSIILKEYEHYQKSSKSRREAVRALNVSTGTIQYIILNKKAKSKAERTPDENLEAIKQRMDAASGLYQEKTLAAIKINLDNVFDELPMNMPWLGEEERFIAFVAMYFDLPYHGKEKFWQQMDGKAREMVHKSGTKKLQALREVFNDANYMYLYRRFIWSKVKTVSRNIDSTDVLAMLSFAQLHDSVSQAKSIIQKNETEKEKKIARYQAKINEVKKEAATPLKKEKTKPAAKKPSDKKSGPTAELRKRMQQSAIKKPAGKKSESKKKGKK